MKIRKTRFKTGSAVEETKLQPAVHEKVERNKAFQKDSVNSASGGCDPYLWEWILALHGISLQGQQGY